AAQLGRPARELLAHLPVEVHVQGARGAALLGEGDRRGRLGERHLGQPHRRRGGGGRRGRGGGRRRHRAGRGRLGGRGGGRRGGGGAVVGGESFEAAAVALADGPELPGALAAVELAQDERRLGGRARAVVAGGDGALGRVLHLDVEVGDPSEGAAVAGGGQD